MKPLLPNKVVSNEITLVEDSNIVVNDKKLRQLGIPQYNETEPLDHSIDNSLMKAIVKYRSHPSINATKKTCNSNLCFSFSQIERNEIIKEINNLKTNKETHSTDIPTKLIKENSDILQVLFLQTLTMVLLFYFSNVIKKSDYNTSS